MENGALRQLAGNGSDAVGEDEFRPTHNARRVRSASRVVPRRSRPSSIPRRTHFKHTSSILLLLVLITLFYLTAFNWNLNS